MSLCLLLGRHEETKTVFMAATGGISIVDGL
jgi:hypothetical protein